MSSWKKGVLWMTGVLVWAFVLSVGLSWLNFGYLDRETVAKMGLLLLPLLGFATVLLVWPEREEHERKTSVPVEEAPAAQDEEKIASEVPYENSTETDSNKTGATGRREP